MNVWYCNLYNDGDDIFISEMFGGIGTDNVITKKFFHEESSFYIAYLAAKSPKFLGNYNIPAGYLVGNGFSFNEEEAKIKALGDICR